ncbi:unnamed protein product [Allacma fusca]|uniref:Uncharacterized protein n=1 Tax=Allacma fusca TaxID=39272 RepID=A0A8J2L1Q2_9HEXA|nr:unnamed protein product [Allacma fusca]
MSGKKSFIPDTLTPSSFSYSNGPIKQLEASIETPIPNSVPPITIVEDAPTSGKTTEPEEISRKTGYITDPENGPINVNTVFYTACSGSNTSFEVSSKTSIPAQLPHKSVHFADLENIPAETVTSEAEGYDKDSEQGPDYFQNVTKSNLLHSILTTSDPRRLLEQLHEAITACEDGSFNSVEFNVLLNLDSCQNYLAQILKSPELMYNFLKKDNFGGNNPLNDLCKCTLEAIKVYDTEMSAFETNGKPEQAVKEKHNKAQERALETFKNLLEQKNMDYDYPDYTSAIKWKLEDNLRVLMQNTVRSDPFPEQIKLAIETNSGQNSTHELNLGAFWGEKSIQVYSLKGGSDNISEVCNFPLNFPVRPNEKARGPCSVLSNKSVHGDIDCNINLVITSAFPFTSYQKKRIQAASQPYFSKSRLISPTTAVAVKFFSDAKNIQPEPLNSDQVVQTGIPQRIIVVFPVKQSFTMAVVELNSGVIESKRCLSSLSYKAFNQSQFKQSHSNLFSKGTTQRTTDNEKVLTIAYKKILDALNFCNDGSEIKTVVLAGNDSSLLNDLLKDVFDSTEAPIVKQAPDSHIQGACLIARNMSEERSWLIRDNTGGTFKVSVTQDGSSSVTLAWQGLECRKVKIKTQLLVTVRETLLSGKVIESCRYSLSVKPDTSGELVDVKLTPLINDDGVFRVAFEIENASQGNLHDLNICLLGRGAYLPYDKTAINVESPEILFDSRALRSFGFHTPPAAAIATSSVAPSTPRDESPGTRFPHRR